MSQQGSQGSQQYNQYGRYGQAGAQEQSTFSQKPYDPFNQQAPTAQSQFEGYPSQQNPSQPQPQQSQPQISRLFIGPERVFFLLHCRPSSECVPEIIMATNTINSKGHKLNRMEHLHPNSARIADTTFPSLTALVHFRRALHSNLSLGTQQPAKLDKRAYNTDPPGQNQQPGLTTQGQQAHPSQPQGQPGNTLWSSLLFEPILRAY